MASSREKPASAKDSSNSIAALLSAAASAPMPIPSDTASNAIPCSLSKKAAASPQGLPICPEANAVAVASA